MKPIATRHSNRVYKAPNYGDLPAAGVITNPKTGQIGIITEWELTDAELEEIIHSKRIYLTICSTNIPPVCIQTGSPFEDGHAPEIHSEETIKQ